MRGVDLFFKIFHKLWQGRTLAEFLGFKDFQNFQEEFGCSVLTFSSLLSLTSWWCLFFFWINCLYWRNIILYSLWRVLNFLSLAILFKTCFKNLHSLSYQGFEGKLFFMFSLGKRCLCHRNGMSSTDACGCEECANLHSTVRTEDSRDEDEVWMID